MPPLKPPIAGVAPPQRWQLSDLHRDAAPPKRRHATTPNYVPPPEPEHAGHVELEEYGDGYMLFVFRQNAVDGIMIECPDITALQDFWAIQGICMTHGLRIEMWSVLWTRIAVP